MDFALIMFVLLLVTGGVWLLDRFALAAKRGKEAAEPWWSDAKSFFPVILVVFFIRSFLIEPFKIPSGSMIPTLQVGDFILVNKFTYGVRLPIINQKIIPINDPQRGDVMVFRYPKTPRWIISSVWSGYPATPSNIAASGYGSTGLSRHRRRTGNTITSSPA